MKEQGSPQSDTDLEVNVLKTEVVDVLPIVSTVGTINLLNTVVDEVEDESDRTEGVEVCVNLFSAFLSIEFCLMMVVYFI